MIKKNATALKNLPGLNEADLISSAQKADLQAFNRIVLLYQDEIFALALLISGDGDSAEDITQHTFLAAYHGLSPFRNEPIRRRLYQIAAKTCFDKLQRGQSQPVQPLEYDLEKEEHPLTGINFSNSSTSPENGYEGRASDQLVQQALRQLDAYQRGVVFLVDLQEFSYREVALILGMSVETVKSHLARARLQLHDQMSGLGGPNLLI
jgi:RNA polymerase sigma-70 factor (ECF subfamily)